MCYSPVRHSLAPKSKGVRLACVRHAASVYPEPGSNSPSVLYLFTHACAHATNAASRRCDPGQAVVFYTWLFADCLLPFPAADCSTREHEQRSRASLTGTAVFALTLRSPSYCSAFHFSIVKVPLEARLACFSIAN